MLGKEFKYVIRCPVCGKKERITIYEEELKRAKGGLKEITVRHFDVYPHDIKIAVDLFGNIRGVYIQRIERKRVRKYRFIVARESYPIVVKTDAAKKVKDKTAKSVLQFCDGFNSIDDIASLIGLPKLKVMDILAVLRKKGIIELVDVFKVEAEEEVILV